MVFDFCKPFQYLLWYGHFAYEILLPYLYFPSLLPLDNEYSRNGP